jgi:hypothetical protein
LALIRADLSVARRRVYIIYALLSQDINCEKINVLQTGNVGL